MSHITVTQTLLRLDAWLETMRGSRGYGGPIAHWWETSLIYTGPMIDWRYEGILGGYVRLYEKTGNSVWLDRALKAGDDVCQAQLPDGRFRNSSFQQGPMEGGTPHEAAVDVGLLELAQALRTRHDDRWEVYFQAAEANLKNYHIACLWNGEAFLDQPWNQTVVANKNATTATALLLYEAISGTSMEEYITGAARLILRAQVNDSSPRQGGIVHLGTGKHQLAIGIYTARCVPVMLQFHTRYDDDRYLSAAQAMGRFLVSLINEHGTAMGYYPDGRRILCPTWISPSGDVLRALVALQPFGDVPQAAIDQLIQILADTQLASGGIPTAYGLGKKGNTSSHTGLPDFRDILPVVGWCDKAFLALAIIATNLESAPELESAEQTCIWKKRKFVYRENAQEMILCDDKRKIIIYRWEKPKYYPTHVGL